MTSTLPPGRLVTELMGFPPQVLLDDMVNGLHESVHPALESVHSALRTWLANKDNDDNDDLRLEVEEGMIALQTLLDSNNDIAADGFETWSLRNIFTVEPGNVAGTEDPKVVRQVVVPHYKGLDLDIPAREEADAWMELDELQRKIEGHRRMRSLLRAGNRAAEAEAERSRRRLDKYDFLRYLVEDPELEKLPGLVQTLLENTHSQNSSKPTVDDLLMTTTSAAAQPPKPPTGPRSWETSKAGYVHWAVQRILQTDRTGATPLGLHDMLDNTLTTAQQVGDVAEVDRAINTIAPGHAARRKQEDEMETES